MWDTGASTLFDIMSLKLPIKLIKMNDYVIHMGGASWEQIRSGYNNESKKISDFLNPNESVYISLVMLCLGNCFIHIAGAECTLRYSNGKMAHSAIFVAGGSFGVVTGKILASYLNYKYIKNHMIAAANTKET